MRALYWIVILVICKSLASQTATTICKAVFDCRGKGIETGTIVSLDVPWEFYWNKHIQPGGLGKAGSSPDTIIKPGAWENVKLQSKTTDNTGFATYRILLINLPSENELMLDAYSIQTSATIFINGRAVASVGKPGINSNKTTPMNRDEQLYLPKTDSVEIVVHAANFHHRKGGFVHPFEIGKAKPILKQRLKYYILDFTESSALAIMGLFLFALYIFRRKDISILYFSLFCISLSFRPVISVNYLLATLFPDISWEMMIKLEYLAVLLPCLFMTLFIRALFPNQIHHTVVKIISAILIVKIAATLFTPPSVFSWLVLPLLFIISGGVIIFAITIVRAIIAKVEGANYAGLGLVLLLCSLLLKVMVYSGIITPVHVLITILDIAFIFSMSLILGARFSMQFTRAERLQKKTELQHAEIERQKRAVESQKTVLEEQNKNILDSIRYAKRIQQSLLAPQVYIQKTLSRLKSRKG